MSLVLLDTGASAQFTINLVQNGLKSVNGPKLKSIVKKPLTVQDYSPQVARATDGTDCAVIAVIAEANHPPFLTAFASSGGKQRIYGPQGTSAMTGQPLGAKHPIWWSVDLEAGMA